MRFAADRDGPSGETDRKLFQPEHQPLHQASLQRRGGPRLVQRAAVHRADRRERPAKQEPVVAVEMDDIGIAEPLEIEQQRA